MKRLSLIALSMLLGTAHLGWAKGAGTTTGELLKIPVGTRAIGMGEAYTAAADDTSAMFWNPAGMTYAEQKEATFMHSTLIEDVHYEHLSFIAPGESYSFGGAMSYLGYGDIAGYDNSGGSIGDQSANSYIISGAMARRIGNRLSLGVTGSLLRQKLADESAGTFAFNLGALYDIPVTWLRTNYRAGLAVENLGQGLKFVEERDPLPRKIRMGLAALNVHEWPLNVTMDVTIPNDNDTYIGVGSEYWFKQMIALRLGYAGSNDEGRGLRMGVGLKLRGILFDYAYGSFGDFGATHRISVSLRFGTRTKQMNDAQKAILQEAKRSMKDGREVEAILDYATLLDQDPDNHAVLKRMIDAHEVVLKKELNEAIAKTNEEIPSAEEFALQDLIPGQEKVAKAGSMDPNDPLNLNALPEAVDILDAESANSSLPSPESSAIAPALVPAQPSVTETQAVPGSSSGAASDDSATSVAKPEDAVVTEQAVPTAEDLLSGQLSPAASSAPSEPATATSQDMAGDGPMLNPNDFK